MKLQLCRTDGALCVALPLAILSLCFFGQTLSSYCSVFHELQAVFRLEPEMLLASPSIWCGTFVFLTFSQRDWPLLTLLLVALAWYAIGHEESLRVMDAVILLAGVTLGKGLRFALKVDGRLQVADGENILEIENRKLAIVNFLVGLVLLLAFASWWHLEPTGAYRGPRWMGLWDNPNIYGMLMGAGVVLAIGLLAANSKFKIQNSKLGWLLVITAWMMAVGVVMSYSRGTMLATAVGLLYLAWSYGKLKWRLVVPVMSAAAAVLILFWHGTADNAPWYLKRLDFSRPSAQHRVSAWRGALQMMRDHPLGVGWNQAVSVYDKSYSPPEGGAAALTMNSYLMLGTELGLPGLLCFVAYVGLCFRTKEGMENEKSRIKTACRAGALVFVVAFWFDGGLFDLPTAALFWVLLELGASNLATGIPLQNFKKT
jgi:O-antigen ligase